MNNPNIAELDYATLRKIQTVLDDGNTMERFLETLPPEYCSYELVQDMKMEGYKYNMTPAKYLLLYLSSRGICVSDLIEWFEAMNLEKALVLLKKDEPLRIIQQPPPLLCISEGSNLVITCKAVSYPPPEYQWFKGMEELLLQQESELSLNSVRLEDSGEFVCRIIKQNTEKKDYSYLFSDFVKVEVIPVDRTVVPFEKQEFGVQPIKNSCKATQKSVGETSKRLAESGKISIIKQPFTDGKVPQGVSLCLICEAVSSYPVMYQWYRNGRILEGKTSSKLLLESLYPDRENGDRKWEYNCKVDNGHEHVFSHTAIVELKDANDSTPYFAEDKIALLIANDTYDNLEELRKPAPDVADLAKLFSAMNFKVFAFRNLNLTEMKNAFHAFCQLLKKDMYALFYFAGHGFELYGQTYLQPIDCSSTFLPDESICTEHILECMQNTNPALNVLFIDACRKLPPQLCDSPKLQLQPGKIFQAKMKNNTIYGYSTSFLYASHESDSERNSFFVKYLKKYVTHNKRIQDVIILVQRDFEGDPLINDVQYPVIKSTLSASRKLCDPIHRTVSLPTDNILSCIDINGDYDCKTIHVSSLQVTILIEFHYSMEVFCNGFDVFVYMDVKREARLKVLRDIEMDVTFNSVRVIPKGGISLKNVNLKLGEKSLLFKKQIFDTHKMKCETLNGKILLTFRSNGRTPTTEFSVNIVKVALLRLSENRLKSSNCEERKLPSMENNILPEHLDSCNACSFVCDNTHGDKDLVNQISPVQDTPLSEKRNFFQTEKGTI